MIIFVQILSALLKRVNYLLLLFCLTAGINSYAQKVTGLVIDKITKQPITGALITAEGNSTRTNPLGQFEISLAHLADTLKITALSYKTLFVKADKPNELLKIDLEPKITNLNEVTIYGDRNFKKDSLINRAAFARQFNYKRPRVIDAFTNGTNFSPGQLISINVLLLIQALTAKSTPEYKFNKLLIKDEHEQFVDEHFNRGIVTRITLLKGDTLSAFLVEYQPTYAFVLKATDYDMEVYVKGCLEKFRKSAVKSINPFEASSAKKNNEKVKLN